MYVMLQPLIMYDVSYCFDNGIPVSVHSNAGQCYCAYVKAPRSLDSTTCTKLNQVASEQTSRESLVLLETTQSLLVREEVTLGSFQERWIGNQVKLRA